MRTVLTPGLFGACGGHIFRLSSFKLNLMNIIDCLAGKPGSPSNNGLSTGARMSRRPGVSPDVVFCKSMSTIGKPVAFRQSMSVSDKNVGFR